jgi:hypothetical protein
VVVELAGEDLVRGADDELGLVAREVAIGCVHQGAGLLQLPEGAHHLDRHLVVADCEVMQGALGLRAPVAIGGDVDRPHGVGLGPGRGLALGHASALFGEGRRVAWVAPHAAAVVDGVEVEPIRGAARNWLAERRREGAFGMDRKRSSV